MRKSKFFVTGNLSSRTLDLNAYAWVLFVVTFMVIIRVCYSWMAPGSVREEHCVLTAAQKSA